VSARAWCPALAHGPRSLRAPAALALALAAWHGGRAAWIEGKAQVAQVLLRHAWRETLAGARDARPWPWADTRPVARLLVPRQGFETFVLAGASGRTMAFGPGHLDGTPLPGEPGNAVISGHRDTHFAFLRRLARGDEVVVETPDGRQRRYAVTTTRIVDRHDVWIVADAGDTRLTLVTCYPFDAIRPGGPLRYVVVARATEDQGGEGRGGSERIDGSGTD
jgi:sortase A